VAFAQVPRVGIIDFYGLNKVRESRVRQALGAREGDPLPPSKGDIEVALEAIDGVVAAHVEAVCCDDSGQAILYVGIEERGAPHFDLRNAPAGEAILPAEIAETYRRLMRAIEAAARRGSVGEDLTRGHALAADPEARAIQETLPDLVKENLEVLRDVLRNGPDERERATAAVVIAYAPRKRDAINDLQYALKDPDPGVRQNAARALVGFAVLQRVNPEAAVNVSATWFVEMLNSLSWSDRTTALAALQILTDGRERPVLDYLKSRALDSLAEMARWKWAAHALPAYVLLGRIAGFEEREIQDSWTRGDREPVIAKATGKRGR
jgi:hypothetical protein